MKRLPVEDLEHIVQNTQDVWESFREKSIFITGGTGFFGKWLLESFICANEKLNLNAKLTTLTRDPESFLREFPFYNQYSNSVKFVKGDILSFDFNLKDKFQFIIHAATAASESLNKINPLLMMDTITVGTRRVLDFAITQPIEGFLFISSGAIYGKQPWNITHIKEDDSFRIDINDPKSAYAEGKRIAELYCSTYFDKFGLPVKIARCFAFVGPYLPLNSHFAIGNFINNVLNGENLVITGDGSTIRSYMYASDLTILVWKILFSGINNKPYNVGVDNPYSLNEIASLINLKYGNKVQILNSNTTILKNVYVPNIDTIKTEFDLSEFTQIEEAIHKTVKFNLINV
jgi:nucleoside-diphosphate-sugar epimerase